MLTQCSWACEETARAGGAHWDVVTVGVSPLPRPELLGTPRAQTHNWATESEAGDERPRPDVFLKLLH